MRGLEQRHPRPPVRGVVARGVEQARQQQRPHHAQLLAERVLDPQRLHVRDPQLAERLRRGEALRDRPQQPVVAEQVLDRAARLAAGQLPDGPLPGGQRRGQLSRPWIRATSSIRSASRWTSESRQGGTVTPSSSSASRPRRSRAARGSPAPLLRDALAEQASPSARAAAAPRAARPAGIRVDRPRHEPRSAELHHQPRGEPLRSHGQLRVQLLLEARRRLGPQPEGLRGPHDVRAHQLAASISTRVVESDISEICAAHDAGDPLGPRRRTRAPSPARSVRSTPSRVAIVSPLRARRTTIRAAAHLVEVERVQRLPGQSIT